MSNLKLKSIAIAILSTIGSCQPAALVAGTATAGASQRDENLSIGPDVSITPPPRHSTRHGPRRPPLIFLQTPT
jgi:hypothetical protein